MTDATAWSPEDAVAQLRELGGDPDATPPAPADDAARARSVTAMISALSGGDAAAETDPTPGAHADAPPEQTAVTRRFPPRSPDRAETADTARPQRSRTMLEHELEDVITRIGKDCPGFIAASVVDMDSGMTLAVHHADPTFDLATASAFNSEMVKQKLKIMQALGLDSELEDMLLTLSDQIHLIKLFGDSFLYLAADREGSNLALVRNAVHRHSAALAG